jgi:hypothetical protein
MITWTVGAPLMSVTHALLFNAELTVLRLSLLGTAAKRQGAIWPIEQLLIPLPVQDTVLDPLPTSTCTAIQTVLVAKAWCLSDGSGVGTTCSLSAETLKGCLTRTRQNGPLFFQVREATTVVKGSRPQALVDPFFCR